MLVNILMAELYESDTLYPYLMNGFSHRYQSTSIFKGVRSNFLFLFLFFFISFSMKSLCANRIVPGGTLRSAASHLGLYCLPMSHKRETRLI